MVNQGGGLSLKLSLILPCLNPLLRTIFQKLFFEVVEGGRAIFSICFDLTRQCRPYLSRILSPSYHCPWGLNRMISVV
jgi:hypothetical protein